MVRIRPWHLGIDGQLLPGLLCLLNDVLAAIKLVLRSHLVLHVGLLLAHNSLMHHGTRAPVRKTGQTMVHRYVKQRQADHNSAPLPHCDGNFCSLMYAFQISKRVVITTQCMKKPLHT